MPETMDFHISDILSITTGRAVSCTGEHVVDGIYKILSFMTGDNLFTHQLARASGECKPVLLCQHPQLADVDAGGVNRDNWRQWVAEQVAKFGEFLPVTALAETEHVRRDPLAEAVEMMGADRVIPVVVA